MTDIHEATTHTALSDVAARTLANATKTVPMLSTITPPLVGAFITVETTRSGYL